MPLTSYGAAVAETTYAAYKDLRAVAPILGAVLEASEAAAIAAVLAEGALVLGAGLLGYGIGQAIFAQLDKADIYPPPSPLYHIGKPGERYRITAHSQLEGQGVANYDNVFDAPILIPLTDEPPDSAPQLRVYARANGVQVGYFTYNPGTLITPLTVDSIARVDNPAEPTIRTTPTLPFFQPLSPFTLPTTIPVSPDEPDFPITPTVIPNPGNDPTEEAGATKPGVVVQIPEIGLQIQYSPTGVLIGKYNAPDTLPYQEPKVPPPTGTPPVKTDACPCPDDKPSQKELLCRVKKLQKELLDDGYTEEIAFRPASSATEVSGLGKGFYKVETNAVVIPEKFKRVAYNEPAPTAIFLGYLAFEIGGVYTQQIPIRFQQEAFLAPEGATGYVIGMNAGGQCSSAYFIRTKKPYVDECVTPAV